MNSLHIKTTCTGEGISRSVSNAHGIVSPSTRELYDICFLCTLCFLISFDYFKSACVSPRSARGVKITAFRWAAGSVGKLKGKRASVRYSEPPLNIPPGSALDRQLKLALTEQFCLLNASVSFIHFLL